MASTYTTNIRLNKQGDGDNPNSWGTILNTQALDMIDEAITAYTTVTCSSGDITLTVANGTTDQARSAILEFVGTCSAATNVIIPDKEKFYIINDKTTRQNDAELKVKTGTGSGNIINSGEQTIIFCDSVTVYGLDAAGLATANTFTAANTFSTSTTFTTSIKAAHVSATNIRSTNEIAAASVSVDTAYATNNTAVRNVNTVTTLTDATTITCDLNVAQNFHMTLGANRVLLMTNPTVGQTGYIYVIQDGTGSRTLTYPSQWKYSGGTSPTLTTTGNAVDVLVYNVRSSTLIDVLFAADFK
tara:strand:+ start:211 stop:1113 length:903 start_codon:yes stop_codon:yes gene_type:complete